MNIVDPILFQCRQQPPVAAICVPGAEVGLISYRRLALFVHNISRRLTATGLRPGQLVAVNIEDQIFHIAMLLALARLGMASVSARGAARPPLPVDGFITDKTLPAGVTDRVILADMSWTEGDGIPVNASPVRPDDLCRVILTSGTTGEPKGVPISHRLLADRIARHTTVFGARVADCRRIYSDMPITTSLGFQFLLATLWRGGTYFLPGDSFASTLTAMEQYQTQCVLAPPRGLELAAEMVRGDSGLSEQPSGRDQRRRSSLTNAVAPVAHAYVLASRLRLRLDRSSHHGECAGTRARPHARRRWLYHAGRAGADRRP